MNVARFTILAGSHASRLLPTIHSELEGVDVIAPLTNGSAESFVAENGGRAGLVLLGGRVWTGGPSVAPGRPRGSRRGPSGFTQAVAIARHRILAVGSNDEIRTYVQRNTAIIDLGGRLAIPGFVDAHTHFFRGSLELLQLDFKEARNEAEFTRRLAQRAKSLAPGRWVLGGGWDEGTWPSARLPTRNLVDPVTTEHPVLVHRLDRHTALANSLALELAGITKQTEAPQGGVIGRDPNTGEPNGLLKDAAVELVWRVIPPPTETEMEQALKAGLAEARRLGVTSVHDVTLDNEAPNTSFAVQLGLLRRAELEGWLTCRFYEMVPIARSEGLAEVGTPAGRSGDFVRLGGVKAFADGSLGSRTAWMFEPFEDDPGNRGLPLPLMDPPARMERLIRDAVRARIQVAIHAIGDRANAQALDILERAGADQAASRRFRIEHAQHVRPEDFSRFGKLGIVASMQPYHALDDGRWVEKRIGHKRARSSYAWRSMLAAGAPLAFGSDWPAAPLNPLLGVYAAVTRATLDGKHRNGWFPQERLSVDEALRAYTWGGAYAAFEEEEKGTIAPGKLADVIVLSEDLFEVPPERIREARVVTTIVGGRVVYKAE